MKYFSIKVMNIRDELKIQLTQVKAQGAKIRMARGI